MEAENLWKTGSLVQLTAGSRTLVVLGYDDVGSVICKPFEAEIGSLYIVSSLLVNAEHPGRSGATIRLSS